MRTSVEPEEVGDGVVRLRVRDVRTAYAVSEGGTTTRVAARGERTWLVMLVRGPAGWRIGAVEALRGQ